jgi:hypothetical protein
MDEEDCYADRDDYDDRYYEQNEFEDWSKPYGHTWLELEYLTRPDEKE